MFALAVEVQLKVMSVYIGTVDNGGGLPTKYIHRASRTLPGSPNSFVRFPEVKSVKSNQFSAVKTGCRSED